MRSAVNQANQTFNNSTNTAAQYGAGASGIGSTLTPFLMQRLQNPQGFSQGDLTSMLSSALASQGGSTSGITGQAEQQAARTRNDAGFSAGLGDAARQQAKNLAATSEGIAGNNANLKEDQRTNAQKMLQGLYGTDVGAQHDATQDANQSIQNAVEANKTGWFQNMTSLLASINGAGVGKLKL